MKLTLLTAASVIGQSLAQSSCLKPSGSIRPSVASGYQLQVVATGLSRPRGLAIDSQGHLLVVEAGAGTVTSHVISEQNGCVTATDSKEVVGNLSLNHGIQINGTTLYASSSNSLYSFDYDANARTSSNQQELVNGMEGSDHSTRTLEVMHRNPGWMMISRGSLANLDGNSTTIAGGTAQVRAFNLAGRTGVYGWQDGVLLGWGNRNEVGLAEHPDGGLWGVENSADQISRDGVDVSNNNPGEELNSFGNFTPTQTSDQAGYYGYPWCLAVWNVTELPMSSNLTIGSQFAFDEASALDNQNRTDEFCSTTRSPRLVFQAHMAPLDIKFNNSGNDAWITFHGSWDRQQPVGYRMSRVAFANGQPVDEVTSTTAENIIVSNEDDSVCPDNCFRPVAMAFDSQGRIFMSSDSTGEIYLVSRNASSTGTSSGSSPSSSSSASSVTAPQAWPAWLGTLLMFSLSLLF